MDIIVIDLGPCNGTYSKKVNQEKGFHEFSSYSCHSHSTNPKTSGVPESSGTPHPGDAEEMARRRGLQCRHGQSAAPSAGAGAARRHGESPTQRWRGSRGSPTATAGADSGRGCGTETWLKAGESEERFSK